MNIALGETLVILILCLMWLLPLWGIIDAAIRPDDVWAAAQQNKVVWVVVQIFVPIVGTLAYFVAIRPKLKAVAARDAAAPL